MANYPGNMNRYSQMNHRVPDYEPTRVVFDRVIGIAMMLLFGVLGILIFVTIISGSYTTTGDLAEAAAFALLCVALVIVGRRMYVRSDFYVKSRRYLREPGSISMKALALNTKNTLADTEAMVKNMTRYKYYTNLSITADHKTVQIAKIEVPQEK